jgi:hypothetical protein
MFANKDTPLSKTKKFSIMKNKHELSTFSKYLFLKVPFSQICGQYVAILVKVFKGKASCPHRFFHLAAQSVIKVSSLFWKGMKCGVASDKNTVEFYEPDERTNIEEFYKEFFSETDTLNHKKDKSLDGML